MNGELRLELKIKDDKKRRGKSQNNRLRGEKDMKREDSKWEGWKSVAMQQEDQERTKLVFST